VLLWAGIATGYRLDGLGIKSLWEARFSAPRLLCDWGHKVNHGVKRRGGGVDHPPPSSACN